MAGLHRGLRIALSLGFLYFGLEKLLSLPAAVALYDALGFGQWPRYVTGSVETLGAIAIWTPVSPLAAAVLALTMAVGFTAKTMIVGPPVLHIAILGIGVIILGIMDLLARRRS